MLFNFYVRRKIRITCNMLSYVQQCKVNSIFYLLPLKRMGGCRVKTAYVVIDLIVVNITFFTRDGFKAGTRT